MLRPLSLLALVLVLGACGAADDGHPCRLDSECAAGLTCVDGACVLVETPPCDPACGELAPICDPATGTCHVCLADADCPGASPHCLADAWAGRGRCVACRDDTDCPGASVCDPDGQVCRGCLDDAGCPAATPVCDAASATCAVCTDDRGCGGGTFCDRGAACVVCTPERGCADGLRCDTAAPGGACVACLGDEDCDEGLLCSSGACVTCSATRGCEAGDVCDLSVPGGACVGCVSDADCAAGVCDLETATCVTCDELGHGCGGDAPVCDRSVPGGACVGCLADADCPGARPVCDPARQACVVCAVDADCEPGAPTCDARASDGLGACVGCLDDADCAGERPVCDALTCVTCTADRGCPEAAPRCDLSVPGGACYACAGDADCPPDRPLCDGSVPGGACRTCTAEHRGCGPATPYCAPQAAGGAGACVACRDDADCGTGRPYCDRAAAYGAGACQVCTATRGCAAPTPACDTSVPGAACRVCTAATGCGGATPVCDVGSADGQGTCVGCLDDGDCGSPTPRCHPTTRTCVRCASSPDCAYTPRPVCDDAGSCVVCTATEGCGGATPFCLNGSLCGACASDTDCQYRESCSNGQCYHHGSAQIARMRAWSGPPWPVTGTYARFIPDVVVTALHPSRGGDSPGFFIQGVPGGPAIFVAANLSSLSPPPAPGDRVSILVDAKTQFASRHQITALGGYAWLGTGVSLPLMTQDVSNAADLVTDVDAYESELVSCTGTIAGPFQETGSYPGTGWRVAPLATAGLPTGTLPELRTVPAVEQALGLVPGCVVRLVAGPVWRHNGTPGLLAYQASDLQVLSCPAAP